ncbi:acetoacetate--CoA ligase [Aquincola sp. MAHUQ-54]|uniref:Acetoacetate--CoA ligase n=1 Tax=Aquincola agrisoli TaxID=3119538 RepID=A0AAW9Q7W1_9BURK
MIAEGQRLWTPRAAFAAESQMARYMDWLRERHGLDLPDYAALWRWSIDESQAFWRSIWSYFDVRHDGAAEPVLVGEGLRGARWFTGARVNYAEHLLLHEADAAPGAPAFHHLGEARPRGAMSWQELGRQVRIVATRLRAMGVGPGDRVVSYMPNVPETAVAMIATVAIGAVWSSAAIEFGVRTVVDRFAQIAPKVLLAADGYRFAGKCIDRRAEAAEIAAALPSLERVLWLPCLDPGGAPPAIAGLETWASWLDHPEVPRAGFRFERVAHDHPLWVVFSSGTTGLPKAIVHGHAGMLAEHLKLMHLHLNLGPGAVMFFYSTTGWMMWNLLVAALLTGAAAVLYDGSPMHPDPGFLWQLAAETRTTCFGASPTYVQHMEKAGLRPGEVFDLSALESVIVSGAPSTPETFGWLYECVKRDLWVTSQSGGTEICSGFVGASPLLPVYAGEIQARMLGMAVQVWDDAGRELHGEVGELVVTRPFPSMPIRFWNDPDDARYREAYFEHFPGVWRHGDFIRINERGGCYIHGRSDSTLNRHGVRIGSAEIYRVVEELDEVADSLVVCCEQPGGQFYMPLFLRLAPGRVLDVALRERIAQRLRTQCSPRHVPDRMVQVDAIPYTLTGKKMEVPVRKLLMGWPPAAVASRDAMADPAALDWFAGFAREQVLG